MFFSFLFLVFFCFDQLISAGTLEDFDWSLRLVMGSDQVKLFFVLYSLYCLILF